MISIRKLWPQPPRGSISYLHLSVVREHLDVETVIVTLWCNKIFVLLSSVVQSWQTTETGDVLETVIKKFSPGNKGRKTICNFAKFPIPEQKSKSMLCFVLRVWACLGQIMKSLSAQIIEMTDTFPWEPAAAANIHTEHSSHGSIELELTRAITRAN